MVSDDKCSNSIISFHVNIASSNTSDQEQVLNIATKIYTYIKFRALVNGYIIIRYKLKVLRLGKKPDVIIIVEH